MRWCSLVAVLGLVCSLLHARIGESCAGCERRYGAPVRESEDGSLLTYRSHRLSIAIHFTDGTADMLSYHRLPSSDGKVRSFTDDEVQAFLAENAGGRTWVAAQGGTSLAIWRTQDGALGAMFDRVSNHLMIYTDAFAANGLSATF